MDRQDRQDFGLATGENYFPAVNENPVYPAYPC